MAKEPNSNEGTTKSKDDPHLVMSAPTAVESSASFTSSESTKSGSKSSTTEWVSSAKFDLTSSALATTPAEAASASTSSNSDSQASKLRKLSPPPPTTIETTTTVLADISVDNKCLLLRNTTNEKAPVHLIMLLQHYDTAKLTQPELLFLLIYTIALESGFATQNEYGRCSRKLIEMSPISSYHSKNVLTLSQYKPTYMHDAQHLYFAMQLHSIVNNKCRLPAKVRNSLLTAFTTGDYLIVTLTPDRTIEMRGFSICLSIPRYVLNIQARGKPIYQRFCKLEELTIKLRSSLFVPVRNQQLSLLGAQIYPSLLGLPAELYDEILQHLSKNQLNILANVNKHLYYYSTRSKFYPKE